MRWTRFIHHGQATLGRIDDDEVLVHKGDLFTDPDPIPTGERVPLAGLAWLPPCVPGKIIGLWNNFRAAQQKNSWAEPAEPLYFLKSPGCAAGHEQPAQRRRGALGRDGD